MKVLLKIKYSIFIIAVCAGSLFSACKKETTVYGDACIYMPQATTTGGLDNTYLVPSGGGALTYNFKSDAGKIDIMLGVSRSGTGQAKDFAVDVAALNDETNNFVSSGMLANAAALPAGIYSLPSKVTVTGSSKATFYLSVDSVKLMGDPAYAGQQLVLAVGIANPTVYKLSENDNLTMVVIDVDAVRAHFMK